MNKLLNQFTAWFTRLLGRAWATALAILLIVLWGAGIPFIGLNDTYQLVINTTTTIITFVMVFAIQNTQNRDNSALQVKLDAIIQKLGIAEKDFADLETLPDTELEKIQAKYQAKGKRQ